jgi:microcystin-dependent protein
VAANNILPFAQDGGALVQTQAVYAADAERTTGNQPGVARPDFVNKTLRQVAAIAAGLAQFLADNQITDVSDDQIPSALSTMILNAIRSATAMPAGSIVWLPGSTPPIGTIKVNGALLSRTTYARLFTFASLAGNMTTEANWPTFPGLFGQGDGSTTFRIPDLRGYTLRTWDDGKGIDSGRVVGSTQADQNLSHTHTVSDPLHGHGVNDPTHAHLATGSAGIGQGAAGANTVQQSSGTTQTTFAATGITIQSSATGIALFNSGGTEVRVKNIALMPVMFY